MQKWAELMMTEYAILQGFPDLMRSEKRMLPKYRAFYKLRQDADARAHSMGTFHAFWERVLKIASNRAHSNSVFSSEVLDGDRQKREERIVQYTSTNTSLVGHMKKPEN